MWERVRRETSSGDPRGFSCGSIARTRRIDEAVFKVIGGSEANASASLLAERLRGATVEDARDASSLAIVAELRRRWNRRGVAALAVEAAKRAVDDWERKQ
jgi:NifU-like protein involved in Fe-S cluster formation